MKSKIIRILFAAALTMMLSNEVPASARSDIGWGVIKIAAVTYSSVTMAFTGSEFEKWIKTTLDYKELKKYKGYDGKAAMYSLDVTLKPKVGFFSSDPDVYFTINIEGQGEYIVPYIEYGFKGGNILKSVLAPNCKPGSKIQVIAYDSDSTSNEILNNIFKTKVNANAKFSVGSVIPVELSTSGRIQLIQDEQKLMIDAPDRIAEFVFTTPKDMDSFKMNADFQNEDGKKIGSIEIQKTGEFEVDKSIFMPIFYLIFSIGVGLILFKVIKKHSAA